MLKCLCVQHKEPRGPRPVCDLLLEKLATAEAEVVQLVQDSGQNTGRDARGHRSAGSMRYGTKVLLVHASLVDQCICTSVVCYLSH